jgi:hypothetical protein
MMWEIAQRPKLRRRPIGGCLMFNDGDSLYGQGGRNYGRFDSNTPGWAKARPQRRRPATSSNGLAGFPIVHILVTLRPISCRVVWH